jgi:hypothetical protein
MTNSTSEIITTEIAVSEIIAPVTTPEIQEPKKVSTNKEFRAHMATAALDLAAIREESLLHALESNPELKVAEASRRAKYGALGMAADTHARCNGLLSGLSDKEMRVIKDMGITAERLALDPKAGGFSREHKFYITTIAACIVQNRRPDSVDLQAANEALRKLDPSASVKRTGHKSVSYLIDMLQDVTSWTVRHWVAETGAETSTQAAYITGFMFKTGMASVSGTGDSKVVTPKHDHPVIVALTAIK